MHFVGQRDGESQSVGLQRRSLDISSSERLSEDNTRQVGVRMEMGNSGLRRGASPVSCYMHIYMVTCILLLWKEHIYHSNNLQVHLKWNWNFDCPSFVVFA